MSNVIDYYRLPWRWVNGPSPVFRILNGHFEAHVDGEIYALSHFNVTTLQKALAEATEPGDSEIIEKYGPSLDELWYYLVEGISQ